MQPTPYTIYDASAGSGKTSTLVKEYLKLVLATKGPAKFHQLLAITFTNKAVNEMKSRILDTLYEFSLPEASQAPSHLFTDLVRELQVPPGELQERAERLLKELLHNYASFDVSTIDKFNHRLIRTFAKDLQLPQNFEVVLDTDLLLEEAVGNLLARAGEDRKLTAVLIAFALDKIDDDRSWDIAYDLFRFGKLLFSESHLDHIRLLASRKPEDFQELKKKLKGSIHETELAMRHVADTLLQEMEAHDLDRADFTRGSLPDFLLKFSCAEFQAIDFNAQWKQRFNEEVPYNKTCAEATRARIDALLPEWRVAFGLLREAHAHWSLLQNAYRNLVPLTILNALQQEVSTLERERGLLPISSFNSLISGEIKNQPAPFIYERLGEKYRHYFIDEFQDTSRLQWQNLIPLIASALEGQDATGKSGTLLLVGDAKQAIYRWRGGRAEQFLNLINKASNPFTVAPQVHAIPSNYRSYGEIVRFNNSFFNRVSAALKKDLYRDLYLNGSRQQPRAGEGGFVQLHFVSAEERLLEEAYCKEVLRCLTEIRQTNHAYSDVCILTRTRAQGVCVADYLIQHDIPIISSETLLLKNNPKVAFLMALLTYVQTPDQLEAVYHILYFLSKEEPGKHGFIARNLNRLEVLLRDQYGFNPDYVKHASAYDSLEYAIRQFELAEVSDAYLMFLLDEALVVETREDGSILTFLKYWEKNSGKLSIVAPEASEAVQIMTVHKAKGLEFPIVIYPFANTDIYSRRTAGDAVVWLPVPPPEYAGFQEVLLSRKKEMTSYGPEAERLYHEEEEKLELDAFNLLYVALTRAVKALYILSEMDLNAKGEPKTSYFSGLFISYLQAEGLWDGNRDTYSFGRLQQGPGNGKLPTATAPIAHHYSHKNRPEFRIVTKSGMLWDSNREEAQAYGNLIHALMARIHTPADVAPALNALIRTGAIDRGMAEGLRKAALGVVTHPQLTPYFRDALSGRNECELYTADGTVLRPDRIVLHEKSATLIDYKTGRPDAAYPEQLLQYARALASMDYSVENKIIVYINQEVTPEFI